MELLINGVKRRLDANAERSLLSVLRDDLDLTGCKYGCGEGRCGACTVLVDGKATRSCVLPAASAEGKAITTIESLAKDGRLHPLQEAFIQCGAMQCGYCTPGMIVSALGLLRENANPSREDICRGLEGNICRCGTYSRIVVAVQQAAQKMKGGA
jgi:aerobic-type carbon monoxide dehydrogenase small subunit (CoxS/CutS family)